MLRFFKKLSRRSKKKKSSIKRKPRSFSKSKSGSKSSTKRSKNSKKITFREENDCPLPNRPNSIKYGRKFEKSKGKRASYCPKLYPILGKTQKGFWCCQMDFSKKNLKPTPGFRSINSPTLLQKRYPSLNIFRSNNIKTS